MFALPSGSYSMCRRRFSPNSSLRAENRNKEWEQPFRKILYTYEQTQVEELHRNTFPKSQDLIAFSADDKSNVRIRKLSDEEQAQAPTCAALRLKP